MDISVVIPSFNRVASIGAAIKSALAQTIPAAEILVVDDGSTDGTAGLVGSIQATNPLVRLISLPGRAGAPRARNIGARDARAPWIAFLDSDDVWTPQKLELQCALLRETPGLVGVGGWYRKIDKDGNVVADMRPPSRVSLRDMLYCNAVGPTSVIALSRVDFFSVGGFDEKMPSCQDWELYGKLLQRGPIGVVQAHVADQFVSSNDRISTQKANVVAGHKLMLARMADVARANRLCPGDLEARQSSTMVDLHLRLHDYRAALVETARFPTLRSAAKWVRAATALGAFDYH